MPWITLSADDLMRSVSGPELTALQNAARAGGDPVTPIIGEVINEIRGYVASCQANVLGAGVTIPDKLKSAALARIRFELFTRLPLGRSLLTEDRVAANRDAVRLLERVSDCKFAIEEPDTASTEVIGSPSPSVSIRCRLFTRDTQEGL